jgi:hypothetical protein
MVIALTLLMVAAVPIDNGSRATNDDLMTLQGVWEMELKNGNETIRVQKEIRGNRETLRTYRGEQLIHEHKVDFELSRSGEAKVFRWKNGENTFGPRKGAEMPDGAFIYRLKPDRWIGVSGFLPGEDDKPVTLEQYQKVGD